MRGVNNSFSAGVAVPFETFSSGLVNSGGADWARHRLACDAKSVESAAADTTKTFCKEDLNECGFLEQHTYG